MKNGGPAFPVPMEARERLALNAAGKDGEEILNLAGGMSLRDWFAGQALMGWVADPDVKLRTDEQIRYAAEKAYCIADAMLVEREKQQ